MSTWPEEDVLAAKIRDDCLRWLQIHSRHCASPDCLEPAGLLAYLAHCLGVRSRGNLCRLRITAVGENEVLAVQTFPTQCHVWAEALWDLTLRDWHAVQPRRRRTQAPKPE